MCAWVHAQLRPTLCDPMDYKPSRLLSVHGILQARILEWVATSFSRGSSGPRGWTHVSCIGKRTFLPLSHLGSLSVHVLYAYLCFIPYIYKVPTKNQSLCRECMDLDQWFSTRDDFAPQGHLPMSGNSLGCLGCGEGVIGSIGEYRPGMLLASSRAQRKPLLLQCAELARLGNPPLDSPGASSQYTVCLFVALLKIWVVPSLECIWSLV